MTRFMFFWLAFSLCCFAAIAIVLAAPTVFGILDSASGGELSCMASCGEPTTSNLCFVSCMSEKGVVPGAG